MLDDRWGKYLAMPADLFAADRQPSDPEMAVVLQHYDIVAQSPQYRGLTDRPEFRATYDLLRRYMAARADLASVDHRRAACRAGAQVESRWRLYDKASSLL